MTLELFLYAASPFRAPLIFLNSSTVLTTFSYINFLDVCSFLGLDRSPLLATKVVRSELFSKGIKFAMTAVLFVLFPFTDLNRFKDVYEAALSPIINFGCLLDYSHRSSALRLYLVSLSIVLHSNYVALAF